MAVPADEREPGRRWPTQGVIVAPLTVGQAVGKPLQELAHVTPTFPTGIKDSDLQEADKGVQRETALWWFLLNLEPYDPHKRLSLGFSGAYGEGAYGTATYGGGQA